MKGSIILLIGASSARESLLAMAVQEVAEGRQS